MSTLAASSRSEPYRPEHNTQEGDALGDNKLHKHSAFFGGGGKSWEQEMHVAGVIEAMPRRGVAG